MPRRIDPQPWMTDPATRRVMRALADGGARARFVGGCVRDALLGRPISDIDIATDASPERVMSILQEAGIKVVPTGLDHGTVTAVADHRAFEITTLRLDVETFGRRARVAYTDDWDADAARRDFTFNAMSLAPDGTLHDAFGGSADLQAGRVRFVGEARQRIEEDVLRLLRFFRFYAHYGRPPPDPGALAACRAMAPRLPELSAERVRAELLKLLAAPDPGTVVRLMRAEDVLRHVLDEARRPERLDRMVRIEAPAIDPVRRLSAVLDVDGDGAWAVALRLKMSNRDRDRLVRMADAARLRPPVTPALDAAARRRALYRLGAEAFLDLALTGWAGAAEDDGWPALVELPQAWVRPIFPLSGDDVLARGIARGPQVGALLRAVEDWWVDGDFQADRSACLAQLAVAAAE